MKLLPIVTIILVTALMAGPTLMDRCLISCHDDSPADSGVPTCHEHVAASTALSLHGVEACSHDHDGLPADTITDGRAAKVRHVPVSGPAVALHRPGPAGPVELPIRQKQPWRTLSGEPVQTPLRL